MKKLKKIKILLISNFSKRMSVTVDKLLSTLTNLIILSSRKNVRDDDETDGEDNEELNMIVTRHHIYTILYIIDTLIPSAFPIPDVNKAIANARNNLDEKPAKKPKLFVEAKNHLNKLLMSPIVSEITDEAVVYFACILEFLPTPVPVPVSAAPAPAPLPTVPVPVLATPAPIKRTAAKRVETVPLIPTETVEVPIKKRGRPKKNPTA